VFAATTGKEATSVRGNNHKDERPILLKENRSEFLQLCVFVSAAAAVGARLFRDSLQRVANPPGVSHIRASR
jgi:hypothetical protein